MKQMQDFHDRIFSKSVPFKPLEVKLAALTRLNREQLPFLAALEPWFIWGAADAPSNA